MNDDIAYVNFEDKGQGVSYDYLAKYYDFVGTDRNNVPMYRLKSEYEQGKLKEGGNLATAIIARLFGG